MASFLTNSRNIVADFLNNASIEATPSNDPKHPTTTSVPNLADVAHPQLGNTPLSRGKVRDLILSTKTSDFRTGLDVVPTLVDETRALRSQVADLQTMVAAMMHDQQRQGEKIEAQKQTMNQLNHKVEQQEKKITNLLKAKKALKKKVNKHTKKLAKKNEQFVKLNNKIAQTVDRAQVKKENVRHTSNFSETK